MNVIAWRVVHLGSTGAWYTTIAVVHGFFVTANGRRAYIGDRSPGRIKHQVPYTSNEMALEQAVRETARLEKLGYSLDIEPRKLTIDPETARLDEALLRSILNDGEVV